MAPKSAAPKVLGVRVHGDKVTDVEVSLDDTFRAVPVPTKLGVPLVYKQLPGTGGDDSAIRSNVIVRFMADPDDGLAPPEWQYGGNRGPAPPTVLARRDKLPFSRQDWSAVDAYIGEWLDSRYEEEDDMVDEDIPKRHLKAVEFREYICAESEPTAMLSLRFPVGSTVVAQGLSIEELNGQEGEVVQYSRDRVGVRFPGREGVTALRAERLTLLREAMPAVEPPAKKLDAGAQKELRAARAAELVRADAEQIAKRFVDCLHQDTFPEWGDLHYFGVGAEYRSRAQEVLAVWQGAVKAQTLTEEQLTEALVAGSTEQLFMSTCHELAKSKTPNSTYANELIQNRFAALEWDTL